MKEFARKILTPIGIWSVLKRIKKQILYSSALIRWYAKDFTPLFGRQKMICSSRYIPQKKYEYSHSQSGQELFIYEQLFNYREKGFFIEVGGNDPITLSNTYTLEKLGWTGISFEPITSLCDKWPTYRSTICYPWAIGNEEKEVEFREVEADDTVFSYVMGYGEEYHPEKPFKTVKKKMRKLENVLSEQNIDKADIVFIDVDGFELGVLQGINFNKVDIKCICMEVLPLSKEARILRSYLCDKGFKLRAHIGGDDIFTK